MPAEQHTPRDAALGRTTSGWWEVELFEMVTLPSGEQRMAHAFRDHFANLDVAAGIVRDWLPDAR
jgi:hypothetical protein